MAGVSRYLDVPRSRWYASLQGGIEYDTGLENVFPGVVMAPLKEPTKDPKGFRKSRWNSNSIMLMHSLTRKMQVLMKTFRVSFLFGRARFSLGKAGEIWVKLGYLLLDGVTTV